MLAAAGLAGAAAADPGQIEVFFGARNGGPVEGGTYSVGSGGPWLEIGDLNAGTGFRTSSSWTGPPELPGCCWERDTGNSSG